MKLHQNTNEGLKITRVAQEQADVHEVTDLPCSIMQGGSIATSMVRW